MSDLKSAEEVLKFLRTITKRQELRSEKEARRKQQPAIRRSLTKTRQSPPPIVEQKPRRRKVDENVVLRRILDSLQPTMEQFYSNQRQPNESNEKSSATRLKIYLKQNERILKTFIRQEEKHKLEVTKMLNDYEEALEHQYFFTVKDSFRDEIQVLIAKNKVSKENYNALEFMDVLVILIDGQLKVYKDKQGTRLFRNIRLFEIDNVEYNEQPFIFMVITFVKDKSKPHEYLYLKFSNQQSQQKWDRILYMNFRLKDMKKKEFLFEADYQEEQAEVRKVQTDNKPYDVNVKKLIRFFAETGSEQIPSEDPRESSRTHENPLSSSRGSPRRLQTQVEKPSSDTPRQNILTLKLSKDQNPPIPEDADDTSQVSRPDIRRTETQIDNPNLSAERSEKLINPNPEPKQQPSKLEMLESQLQPGLSFEKENFFRNSMKKLTLHGNSFSYVDQKKADSSSAKESDIKSVPVSSISKMIVHDDGKLELYHGPDSKKLVMKGDVELFKQWLKLKMME